MIRIGITIAKPDYHRPRTGGRWKLIGALHSRTLCGVLSIFVLLVEVPDMAQARGPGAPPPLPTDTSLANNLLAEAGAGFAIHETDHFTICYNSSREHLLPLVGRLEGTFDAVWRFAVKSGFEPAAPKARLRVLFFDDQESYARRANAHGIDPVGVAGFYSQSEDISVFSNTDTRPSITQISDEIDRLAEKLRAARKTKRAGRSGNRSREIGRQISILRMQRDHLVETFNKLVIQHEAAHHVLFHLGVHNPHGGNPLWLAEGLACQFEIPQSRNDGRLSTINYMRLADFRDALGVSKQTNRMSDANIQLAIAKPAWLRLRDLIQSPERFHNAGDHSAARYGQAWSLVYFLSRKKNGAFSSYVAKIAERPARHRVNPDERLRVFESSFGAIDIVEREWIKFAVQLRVDWHAAGR